MHGSSLTASSGCSELVLWLGESVCSLTPGPLKHPSKLPVLFALSARNAAAFLKVLVSCLGKQSGEISLPLWLSSLSFSCISVSAALGPEIKKKKNPSYKGQYGGILLAGVPKLGFLESEDHVVKEEGSG